MKIVFLLALTFFAGVALAEDKCYKTPKKCARKGGACAGECAKAEGFRSVPKWCKGKACTCCIPPKTAEPTSSPTIPPVETPCSDIKNRCQKKGGSCHSPQSNIRYYAENPEVSNYKMWVNEKLCAGDCACVGFTKPKVKKTKSPVPSQTCSDNKACSKRGGECAAPGTFPKNLKYAKAKYCKGDCVCIKKGTGFTPVPTSASTTPEIESKKCCLALTAECKACMNDMTVSEFCESTDTWYVGCPAKEGDCCNSFVASCLSCSEDQSTKKFCSKTVVPVSGCAGSSTIPRQEGALRMEHEWEPQVQTQVNSFPRVLNSVRTASIANNTEAQTAAGRVAYASVRDMMNAGATIEDITEVGTADERSWMLEMGGMDYGFTVIGEDYDHASDDLMVCLEDCKNSWIVAEASAMATYVSALAACTALLVGWPVCAAAATAAWGLATSSATKALKGCQAECEGKEVKTDGDFYCKSDSDCGKNQWCDKGTLGVGKNECKKHLAQGDFCSRSGECSSDCCKIYWGLPVCRPSSKCN